MTHGREVKIERRHQAQVKGKDGKMPSKYPLCNLHNPRKLYKESREFFRGVLKHAQEMAPRPTMEAPELEQTVRQLVGWALADNPEANIDVESTVSQILSDKSTLSQFLTTMGQRYQLPAVAQAGQQVAQDPYGATGQTHARGPNDTLDSSGMWGAATSLASPLIPGSGVLSAVLSGATEIAPQWPVFGAVEQLNDPDTPVTADRQGFYGLTPQLRAQMEFGRASRALEAATTPEERQAAQQELQAAEQQVSQALQESGNTAAAAGDALADRRSGELSQDLDQRVSSYFAPTLMAGMSAAQHAIPAVQGDTESQKEMASYIPSVAAPLLARRAMQHGSSAAQSKALSVAGRQAGRLAGQRMGSLAATQLGKAGGRLLSKGIPMAIAVEGGLGAREAIRAALGSKAQAAELEDAQMQNWLSDLKAEEGGFGAKAMNLLERSPMGQSGMYLWDSDRVRARMGDALTDTFSENIEKDQFFREHREQRQLQQQLATTAQELKSRFPNVPATQLQPLAEEILYDRLTNSSAGFNGEQVNTRGVSMGEHFASKFLPENAPQEMVDEFAYMMRVNPQAAVKLYTGRDLPDEDAALLREDFNQSGGFGQAMKDYYAALPEDQRTTSYPEWAQRAKQEAITQAQVRMHGLAQDYRYYGEPREGTPYVRPAKTPHTTNEFEAYQRQAAAQKPQQAQRAQQSEQVKAELARRRAAFEQRLAKQQAGYAPAPDMQAVQQNIDSSQQEMRDMHQRSLAQQQRLRQQDNQVADTTRRIEGQAFDQRMAIGSRQQNDFYARTGAGSDLDKQYQQVMRSRRGPSAPKTPQLATAPKPPKVGS